MTNVDRQANEECIYHLDHAGGICPGCKEEVDEFGNTESSFKFCCFPNCGCDGERLCMAGESNKNARACNVEGMWNLKGSKAKKAVADLMHLVAKGKLP